MYQFKNMSKFISVVLSIVWCTTGSFAGPTTAKYTYNSSDLSYLSNGIQFPVPSGGETLQIVKLKNSIISDDVTSEKTKRVMQLFAQLYDQHEWDVFSTNFTQKKECIQEINTFVLKLRSGEPWATKMFDASGHYNGKFFFGNDYWLGSHSLCIELANPNTNSDVPPFPVQFFVAKVRININHDLTPVTRQLNIGQCLPKSCTPSDVKSLLLSQDQIQHISSTTLNIVDVRNVPGNYVLWNDPKVHIIGGVIVLTITLILVSSIVEVLIKHSKNRRRTINKKDMELENNNNTNNKNDNGNSENTQNEDKNPNKKKSCFKSKLVQILLAFSAVDNGKKILNINNVSIDAIRCIHGLRFFSIVWIILVHTYLEIFSIADNKTMRTLTERGFFYQTISNANFSVDTFFFISGLLVTLTYFRSDAKQKRNSSSKYVEKSIIKRDLGKFLLMILYRFLRLTPAYLFVLGINEIILRLMHNNSVFSPAIIDHVTCSEYWWRNALYINNFYPQSEFCMLWSWYIANDTQFFILASLLLLIAVKSMKHLKFVASSMAILVVLSWITTFLIAIKYDYVARVEEPFALFDQLYDKPWMRIGPYLIGMSLGYYLFKIDCTLVMPKSIIIVCWPLSILCLSSLVYGLGTEGLIVPTSAFYAALGHTGWGLSLAWLTLACSTGYGGPFNSFLSCRLFVPLSRLTYCTYLVHPVLMCLTSFVLDGTLPLHNALAVVIFFGNCVMSFLVAFLISLAYEVPVVNLLKILL